MGAHLIPHHAKPQRWSPLWVADPFTFWPRHLEKTKMKILIGRLRGLPVGFYVSVSLLAGALIVHLTMSATADHHKTAPQSGMRLSPAAPVDGNISSEPSQNLSLGWEQYPCIGHSIQLTSQECVVVCLRLKSETTNAGLCRLIIHHSSYARLSTRKSHSSPSWVIVSEWTYKGPLTLLKH